MAPTDPKQGGSITDMAIDGTSIPSDAGTQRTIPSVPRPGQATEDAGAGLGMPSGATAADNATDMPRNPGDGAENIEVITGTGDTTSIPRVKVHFRRWRTTSKGMGSRFDGSVVDNRRLNNSEG